MAERQDNATLERVITSTHLWGGDALSRLRLRAFCSMLFERLWPLVLPFILIVALFATISWFGLFLMMPRWLHIAVLALFGLSTLAALCLPAMIRIPQEAEVDRRIEQINGLQHEPLSAQTDRIVSGGDDPFAVALWQEHQRRMAERLKNLQTGLPNPRMAERDPWGLRAVVALLFVTGFAYGLGSQGGRIGDAFYIPSADDGVIARIDAWVTPPRYTGRAPVFLTADGSSDGQPITVPQGSIVSVRVIGGGAREKLIATDPDGTKFEIAALKDSDKKSEDDASLIAGAREFRYTLQTPQILALSGGNIQADWPFEVIADTPPRIAFSKEPGRAANGTLQLSYTIDDDYGVVKAFADVVLTEPEDEEALPLYSAPELPLTLPRRGTKEATTVKDLTVHPWAGSEVQLTLVAVDDAGQEGHSESKTIILPERTFANPLARAVIEQRHILAHDAMQRDLVLDMLDAVMLRPADTIKSVAHFLGLRSIRARLSWADSEDELRGVVDQMWDVARGIEDGDLSDAEKRLRQAQEALKQALQNGASQEEIAQLSSELRQAMQDFLREFAQRQQNNPNAQQQPNPNMQTLSEKDLQRMMDQIENLAKQGSRDQAQQLLSQLENLMNNLQMGQAQQNQQGRGGQQGNPMQNQMNKLGELMQRQQQMMNDTFRLDQQMQQYNGGNDEDMENGLFPPEQNGEQEGEAPKSQQEMTDAMRKLQQGQGQLKSDLQKLMDDLKALGLDPVKEFGEAGESMGSASDALGRSEGAQANDEQGNALDALRRGGRDMMQKMQQAMGQGEGGSEGAGQPGGRDPLGRAQGSTGPDFGDGVKVPGEIDIQRARQILDEIRRRLGNALSPQMEKDYLERLLKFD